MLVVYRSFRVDCLEYLRNALSAITIALIVSVGFYEFQYLDNQRFFRLDRHSECLVRKLIEVNGQSINTDYLHVYISFILTSQPLIVCSSIKLIAVL